MQYILDYAVSSDLKSKMSLMFIVAPCHHSELYLTEGFKVLTPECRMYAVILLFVSVRRQQNSVETVLLKDMLERAFGLV
jgi:hypothetical protein